jgi:hypothetical protein
VVGSPLHGVIDFSGCGLMRRLCGIVLHFFHLHIDGAIFGAVVGCATMIHAVRRFECVRPSVMASVMIQCSSSLAALWESFV